jgi:hypothetical protein
MRCGCFAFERKLGTELQCAAAALLLKESLA